VRKLRRDKAFKLVEEKHRESVRGVFEQALQSYAQEDQFSQRNTGFTRRRHPRGRDRRLGSCGEDL
jgi:hypothetical protein